MRMEHWFYAVPLRLRSLFHDPLVLAGVVLAMLLLGLLV